MLGVIVYTLPRRHMCHHQPKPRTYQISTKNGECYAVDREFLVNHFHLSRQDVAELLGVGISQFKRICKAMEIERWPSRKLIAIQRLIDGHQTNPEICETLKNARERLLENPGLPYEKVVPNQKLLSDRLKHGKRRNLGVERKRAIPHNPKKRICKKTIKLSQSPPPSQPSPSDENAKTIIEPQPSEGQTPELLPIAKFTRLLF